MTCNTLASELPVCSDLGVIHFVTCWFNCLYVCVVKWSFRWRFGYTYFHFCLEFTSEHGLTCAWCLSGSMKSCDRMCQSVNVTGVKWMISTLRIHGAGMPFNVTLNENTPSLAIRGTPLGQRNLNWLYLYCYSFSIWLCLGFGMELNYAWCNEMQT